MLIEIWKDIHWYEWLYKVSSIWNIYSCISNKKLKLLYDHDWYLCVNLYRNKNMNRYKVHRLVAKSFIINNENKPQVNHINWIRDDNRLDNLEWVTIKENSSHSFIFLWRKNKKWNEHYAYNKYGSNSKKAKSILQYDLNLNFIKEWWSIIEAANYLWLSKCSISRVCKLKRKTTWWFIFKYN